MGNSQGSVSPYHKIERTHGFEVHANIGTKFDVGIIYIRFNKLQSARCTCMLVFCGEVQPLEGREVRPLPLELIIEPTEMSRLGPVVATVCSEAHQLTAIHHHTWPTENNIVSASD